MAKINSRKKGKRGEKIARIALKSWTNLEFAGVPASGGLRWKKAENISGDIVCTDALHRFDFSIEVKNYSDINFEHLLMPQVKSKITHEFWPQCVEDSIRAKKLPLLMMRYDGMKKEFFIIVIRYSEFKKIKSLMPIAKHPYFKLGKLIFMDSNLLFKTDYQQIKKITSKIIKQLWA
jgi:hypothetical protein